MNKRPTWFKCFLSSKATIDSIPDEAVGSFPELDQLANVVFCTMKPYIDEAFDDYEKQVQAGRSGARKRWNDEE